MKKLFFLIVALLVTVQVFGQSFEREIRGLYNYNTFGENKLIPILCAHGSLSIINNSGREIVFTLNEQHELKRLFKIAYDLREYSQKNLISIDEEIYIKNNVTCRIITHSFSQRGGKIVFQNNHQRDINITIYINSHNDFNELLIIANANRNILEERMEKHRQFVEKQRQQQKDIRNIINQYR